jgi:tetratricopeptide (TPR) repeat protein
MKVVFSLPLAIALAGCATTSLVVDDDPQVTIDSHSLLADVSLARQDYPKAVDEYLAAALVSDEPAFAERATRLAHELELTEQGVTAARRWGELTPDDGRPNWFAGVFATRSNRLGDAVSAFADFIRATEDKSVGFALVLEALVDEPFARATTAIMSALNDMFPNVPAGRYALARLALRSGDFDVALTNSAAAADSDPDWLEAQLLHARALLVAGRSEEGLSIAAKLAQEHSDIEVQLQYAELLLSAGKPREAETRLNDILTTNPGLPEATRALAFLAMSEQRADDAKRYFNDLRAEPPYRSEAFYYLGRLAEAERDFLQATRSYSRVTEGTHAVEAQLRTARIMAAEQGDREGAVRHLRSFGEANPRFAADMLVAQSQLLLQMQQPDAAMQLFNDALAATPDDPALRAAHVQLYQLLVQDAIDRGAPGDAERLLEQALARYKNNGALRYSLALLYQDEGKNRKAVEVLEALVAESPDDPALLNALGYLLTDQFDRHEEARGYIQRALAMNPDSAAIIDSMGWVLFKLREYRSASDYLERAYRLVTSGERDADAAAEIGSHLVDVRWQLGERDSALALLRGLLEQYPNDRHLKEVSARIDQ